MIIFGAGLAGLLCARRLWSYQPEILERQAQLPNNHSALLRFRSNAVGEAIGIPFKKVNVYKGILQYDLSTITNTPNLRDINFYSLKSTGVARERSIINTDNVARYIAPSDLIRQLSVDQSNISYRCDCADYIHSRSRQTIGEDGPIISTIPMPALMIMLKYEPPTPVNFWTKSIWTINCDLDDVEVYQTLYCPYREDYPYRVSITGNRMTLESAHELDSPYNYIGIFTNLLFGRSLQVKNVTTRKQEYGKIVPIDEMARQQFILWATDNFNIYSLGRYATWRNILLDDVLKDIAVIDKFIRQRDYSRRLA